KQCIEDDNITSGELEYGLVHAYKDPERYGKVEWNHIWKHILKKREEFTSEMYDKIHGVNK
ncbi:MAG TPA: hypothetical protein VLA13_08810, partial [Massilibacterium sp.]|nr:hypothetical protein [Massilibacterium sp.]